MTSPLSPNPSSKIYFGKAAETYDEVRNANPVTLEDDLAISKFLDMISDGDRLLDIPCGTGRVLQLIANRDILYFGVDISNDMIEIAKTKSLNQNRASFQLGDARRLDFDDMSFEYLICIKFLKWLSNDDEVASVLKELNRVTSKFAFINIKVRPENVPFNFQEIKDRLKDLRDFLFHGIRARRIKVQVFERLLAETGWSIHSKDTNKASNGFVLNYVVKSGELSIEN